MSVEDAALVPLNVGIRSVLLGGGLAARTLTDIAPHEEIQPQLVLDGVGAIGNFVDGPDHVFLVSEPAKPLSAPSIVSIQKGNLSAITRRDFSVPGSVIDGMGRVLLGGGANDRDSLKVVSLDGNVRRSSLRVTTFDRNLEVQAEVSGELPEVQEPSIHLQFSSSGRARASFQRAAIVGETVFASDFQDGRLYRFDARTMEHQETYQIGRPLGPDRRKPVPREIGSPDWSFHVDASTTGVMPIVYFDQGVWASRTVYGDESVAAVSTSDAQSEVRQFPLTGAFVWRPYEYLDVIARVRDLVAGQTYLWVTGMESLSLGGRGTIRIGDSALGRVAGSDGRFERILLRIHRSSARGDEWRTVPRTVVTAIAAWQDHLYLELTQFSSGPASLPRSYLALADGRSGVISTVSDLTRFRSVWPVARDMIANEAGVWFWAARMEDHSKTGSVFHIGHDDLTSGVIADALDTDY